MATIPGPDIILLSTMIAVPIFRGGGKLYLIFRKKKAIYCTSASGHEPISLVKFGAYYLCIMAWVIIYFKTNKATYKELL